MLSKLNGGLRNGCTLVFLVAFSAWTTQRMTQRSRAESLGQRTLGVWFFYPHPWNWVYSQNPKTRPGPRLQIPYTPRKGEREIDGDLWKKRNQALVQFLFQSASLRLLFIDPALTLSSAVSSLG